jgi:hypothetical protein
MVMDTRKNEEYRQAHELLRSVRGSYIITQALVIAIGELKKVPNPETSNIQDMELILDQVYGALKDVVEMQYSSYLRTTYVDRVPLHEVKMYLRDLENDLKAMRHNLDLAIPRYQVQQQLALSTNDVRKAAEALEEAIPWIE